MAGKKRKGGGGEHGGGGHDAAGGLRWLLTYTDMVTLLLALFIVLWAQSDPNPVKIEEIQSAFKVAFGFGQPALLASGASMGARPIVIEHSDIQRSMIKEKLRTYLLEEKLDAAVNVHLNERGVLIRIYADKVKFDKGATEIPAPYKKILDKVASILETTGNAIEVNGYTDNTSGDNWTISAQRAVNTVKYLQKRNIAPERMSAVGYGEYSPLVPNSDSIRRFMNRRIDIQVLKGPLLKELVDHDKVREEYNPVVSPAEEKTLSPAEGVSPKPLTF
jgi:chemotaxis protein MotB